MDRQAVIQLCRRAKTLSKVEEAFWQRGLWLSEHPDDDEVLEWGERLAMMKECLLLFGEAGGADAHVAPSGAVSRDAAA